MFDLMAPAQPAIAQVRVGEDSRGLAISNDGKYLIAGNYYPSGAVILDALTLKALKIIDTSSIEGMYGEKVSSKVAELSSTPYAPYFIMVLKEAGIVQIIDYSKPNFPTVGEIKNIGHNLHDAFFNQDKGKNFGRYYMVSDQSINGAMAVIDLKEKKLIKKISIDTNAKPHSGQGASWYNSTLKKQLHATLDMNLGLVSIWDNSWSIVKQVKTSDAGLFIGTSSTTPYLWADCAYGKEKNYNEIHLIGKESLELEKIIKIGKKSGQLIDAKTQKVLKEWDATQYIPPNVVSVKSETGKERILPYVSKLQREAKYPIQPRLLHAEPANHGKWMMVSEWTTGRVGIYDAQSGEFVKYINNLITPTYTYSVEHRKNMPGS
jgi:nitrite reductase (NO-forming)/hydroxylamine reductase